MKPIETKAEKPTTIDPRLDKLEKFFPNEKMEKAKARLAKARNFFNQGEQQTEVKKPA